MIDMSGAEVTVERVVETLGSKKVGRLRVELLARCLEAPTRLLPLQLA
jgi:hypothetical protein